MDYLVETKRTYRSQTDQPTEQLNEGCNEGLLSCVAICSSYLRDSKRCHGHSDGPTDTPSYRDAKTHLKTNQEEINKQGKGKEEESVKRRKR